MKEGDVFDLAAVIPREWDDPPLVLTVSRAISWTDSGGLFAVRVERQRTSPTTGRKLKPEHVITLTGEAVHGIPALLRNLAHAFEIGQVEIGKSYPPASE